MPKALKVVLSVAVVLIAIGGYNYPKFVPSLGVDAGPTHYSHQEHLGGTTFGLVNSTTTTLAAYTLVAGDLAPTRQGALYDTMLVTKTVGVSGGGNLATTTYTFPASSTLSYIIPKAGMRATQYWVSATASPSQLGFVLAAGTGIDLKTGSTTPTDLTVWGGGAARLEYIRQADGDITVLINDYQDAD